MKQKILKLFLLSAICVTFVFMLLGIKRREMNSTIKEPLIPAQQEQPQEEELVTEQQAEKPQENTEKDKFPAGKTPKEAWKRLFALSKEEQPPSDIGLYTEMAKLLYKEDEKLPVYIEEPYKIYQRGNYAVIYFEENKYPSVLLCKTQQGWKFDGFHQKKIVRGKENAWGVEKYISPYDAMLRGFPFYFRTDIPLEGKDKYNLADDADFAKQLEDLESVYKSGKIKYKDALNLGKFYSISTLGAKAVPLLEKVREKLADNPEVYKYLAIAYVDSAYDYESAQKQIEKYVKLVPEDVFGYNFLGYILIQEGNLSEAEKQFQTAAEIDPENCYAYSRLACLYKTDTTKQNNFKKTFKLAQKYCTGDKYERFIWLINCIHKGND